MTGFKEKILCSIEQSVAAQQQLALESNVAFIEKAAERIASCYRNHGKVLIAGNGGSLCDAMHFAEELTGFFRKKRKALAAIALSDSAHLSCVANDLGFEDVFARGVEALGQKGDIFIALTTSGNSANLVNACKRATALGLQTIALLGKGGGALGGMCDLELLIEGFSTSDRIQEAHMTALHTIIEIVEEHLFWSVQQSSREDLVQEVLSTCP